MVTTLGDSLGFVSGVYVAVLIPWTLLYTLDFISSKWVCIGKTEMKGRVHLVVITIPISYIVAYIVLQTQLPEPDYKEMYAAVAALVLSGYHLARTVWGLRQLVYLKRWVTETAKTMQDASYKCALDPEMQKNRECATFNSRACSSGLHSLLSKVRSFLRDAPASHQTRAIISRCEKKSPDEIAKSMLLNNTLIDNEFSAGIADHVKIASWSRIIWLPLRPSKPNVTFTRWATAFIAQFGNDWLKDAIVSKKDADPWIEKRKNFALRVLTTAVLQMEPRESHGYLYGRRESKPVSKKEQSFLPPCAWENISRDKSASHVFSPDNILTAFFSNSKGLPYTWQALSEGDEFPTRRRLKPILKEAINGLRPRMQENLDGFGTDHLELFAIFLWVQKNARDLKSHANDSSHLEENFTASEASYEFLQRQLGLDEFDRALQNLVYPFSKYARNRHLWYNRNILEVSCRIDNWLALSSGEQLFSLESLLDVKDLEYDESNSGERSTSEEFPSIALKKRRNESEDMLAQRKSILQNIPAQFMEKDSVSEEKSSKKNTSYKPNKELETQRLRFQLANDETRHDHSEQSLTFMGCVMESLRSGLGEQIFTGQISGSKDKKERESSWKVPFTEDFIEFPISFELWKCLRRNKPNEILHSAVQERMLWECQVGTHHSFQQILSEPDAHHHVASMILCILGFSSLTIRREDEGEQRGVLKYAIRAAVPPQLIDVSVSLEKLKKSQSAKLCLQHRYPLQNSEGFKWKLWRDAFLGRLKAKSKWQKSHGMTQVHVNANSDNLLSKSVVSVLKRGKKKNDNEPTQLMYWEGWPPFREGLAIFEQKYLLVDKKKVSASSSESGAQVETSLMLDRNQLMQRGSKIYGECSPAVLSNSISDIDTALELRPSVMWGKLKNQEEMKKTKLVKGNDNVKVNTGSNRNILDGIRRFLKNSSPPKKSLAEEVQSPQNDVDKIFAEAQALNPSSMFKVAKWVLTGDEGFGQNRDQALTMMENAFYIGKDVEVALLFVKTCIEEASLYETRRDEYLERAFSVVKLLWFDIESRLSKVTEGSNGNLKPGSERVDKIIDMNGTLVKENRTSTTLQDFADRLTMWFHVKGDKKLRDRAITLYESAIIADGDIFAMLKLGLVNATNEEKDKLKIAYRMYVTVKEKLRKNDFTDGIRGNRFDYKDISVKEYNLHDVDEYLVFEMKRGHPGVQNLAKMMRVNGRPEEQKVACKILNEVPSISVRGGMSMRIKKVQDHTIVEIEEPDSTREAEELPQFPYTSSL